MITTTTQTIFNCKCERKECGHEWVARKKPRRCAKCKYYTWNKEDHRLRNPYENVQPGSRIENGKNAPRQPNHKDMLDTLVKAGEIIEDVIVTNGPCNHRKNHCLCQETKVLAGIEYHVARLRSLLEPVEVKVEAEEAVVA